MKRHVIINTFGNYLNVAFAFFFAFIVVRHLSPAEYGVVSVLFAVLFVLTNIFDFGVSAAIYSYLPTLLHKEDERSRFIKSHFIFQTVFSTLCIIIIFLTIDVVDAYILKLHTDKINYYVALFSIPLFIWQNYTLNILFAARKFVIANIALTVSNLFKLGAIFLLISQDNLTITTTLLALLPLSPMAYFLVVGYTQIKTITHVIKAPLDLSHIRIRYTMTFFIATQIFNIASRADLFMIAHFMTTADVGYYGLAQKIVAAILTAINSITQVLSPQFSLVKTQSELTRLMKKSFIFILIPIAFFVGLIITPSFIYQIAFTSDYNPAFLATRFLAGGYMLYTIVSIPYLFFLYTIKKPIIILIINVIYLVGAIALSLITIPRFGLIGPTFSIGLTMCIILGYIGVMYRKYVRELAE